MVINEVFPNPSGPNTEPTEFIELYNSSAAAADITGFTLNDLVGTYTITGSIAAYGFVSFTKSTTNIGLNNGGDTITFKDSAGQPVDTFSYSSTIEDRSYSRIPDGNGDFVGNTSPTQASANQSPPTVTPTPSPTPTPTPQPSNTPVPSLTPTTSPTNTPAPATKPTVKPTEIKEEGLADGETVLGAENQEMSEISLEVIDKTATSSPTPANSPLTSGSAPGSKLPLFLVISGVILTVVGGSTLIIQEIKLRRQKNDIISK